MTISANRADGAQARWTSAGYFETVPYKVTGLASSASGEWMYDAITASGIPSIGDSHPVASGVTVASLEVKYRAADIAMVNVLYEPTSSGGGTSTSGDDVTIEIAATLQPETAIEDVNGRQITVSYDTVIEDENGDEQESTDRTGVELEVMRPQTVIRISRTEARSPLELSRRYQGTVNRTKVFGFDAQQLQVTAITGTTEDNGATYLTTIELTSAPNNGTWHATAIYRDPETGAPPENLVRGVGIKSVQVYADELFGGLGLPSIL